MTVGEPGALRRGERKCIFLWVNSICLWNWSCSLHSCSELEGNGRLGRINRGAVSRRSGGENPILSV